MNAHQVSDILSNTCLSDFHWLFLQIVHFLHFGFTLLVSQCSIWHGFIYSHHLLVQIIQLSSDFLISIVARRTGSRVIIAGQIDLDITVFKEEVHQDTFFSCRSVGYVTVCSSILYAFKGECTFGDYCGVYFYKISSVYFLQKYSVAVSSTLYGSGYHVTFVSATGSNDSSHSEQIDKFFHCFYY